MYMYGLKYVYMATYGHVYPYIQHVYTQIVHTMTSQWIYSQKANARHTKQILLWFNNTQLPLEGCSSSPATFPRGNKKHKHYYEWEINESIDGASIA